MDRPKLVSPKYWDITFVDMDIPSFFPLVSLLCFFSIVCQLNLHLGTRRALSTRERESMDVGVSS